MTTESRDSTPANTLARGRALLPALVSALVIGWVVVSATAEVARSTSGTFDESLYLSLGRQAILAGNYESFAALGVAPLPVRLTWNRPVVEPIDAAADDPRVYRERIAHARQRATWLFAVPLIVVVLAGVTAGHGWAAGSLAAALVALSPNLLAHASLATTDVAFALTLMLVLSCTTAYFSRFSLLAAVALSLSLGTALATKYSAVVLFVALALLFWQYRKASRASHAMAILAGALVVTWAMHGFEVAPLLLPGGTASALIDRVLGWTGYSAVIADSLQSVRVPIVARGIAAQMYLERAGQEAFLLGQTSQTGWWYYFPVALAIKSTPVELVALAVFPFLARTRFSTVEGRVFTTVAVTFAVFALLGRRDLGVRYVLPLVVLIVTAAVAWTVDRLATPRRIAVLALSAVTLQVVAFASIAPRHLSYVNSFAGGPGTGYLKLVDSNLDWGQDLPSLKSWLESKGERSVLLAYFGSAPVAAYGINAVDWRNDLTIARSDLPKWFALSVTYLQGIFVCGDPFAAFRGLPPADRIGYSMMVYPLDSPAVREALASAAATACD